MAELHEGIGDEARLRSCGDSSACVLAMRLKYWKARSSSRGTPSPVAYMRPSFHCASAWPCSAAYSSEDSALSFWPALSAVAPERNASPGVTAGLASGGVGRAVEREGRRERQRAGQNRQRE